MKNLLPGIIFATLGLAILDSSSGIITAAAEYLKTSINLRTAHKQAKIERIAAELNCEQHNIQAVGFQIPEEEEEYYDDDE